MAHKRRSRLAKRLLQTQWMHSALARLGALYIKLVFVTTRWDVVGGEHPRALWESNQPFITAFWHGRILLMPKDWRKHQPLSMLISEHRDGRLISAAIRRFGMRTIVGSTSGGGAQALRAILRCLKNGECVGITPDGPRGPAMRASSGVVELSRLAAVPILLTTVSVRRGRVFKTWDRFLFAVPFTRGVILWSEPIMVARNTDPAELERIRGQLERDLNSITAEADRLCGRSPIDLTPRAHESKLSRKRSERSAASGH